MPLSEHEQRILAELEESLVRQDPEFAERVRSETVYRHAGRYCKWAAVGVRGRAWPSWSASTPSRWPSGLLRRGDHVRLGGGLRAQPAADGQGRLARPHPVADTTSSPSGAAGYRGRGARRPGLVPDPLPPPRPLTRRRPGVVGRGDLPGRRHRRDQDGGGSGRPARASCAGRRGRPPRSAGTPRCCGTPWPAWSPSVLTDAPGPARRCAGWAAAVPWTGGDDGLAAQHRRPGGGFPLRPTAGRADRAADLRRQRRQGAWPWPRAGAAPPSGAPTTSPWSSRPGWAAGSCSTVGCSTGRLGNAGHIGHVVVEPDGRRCRCGGRGCLEAEASGTAIAAITGPPAGRGAARGGRADGHAGRPGRGVGGQPARPRPGRGRRFGGPRLRRAVLRRRPGRGVGSGPARLLASAPVVRPAGLGAEGPLVGAGAVGWRGTGPDVPLGRPGDRRPALGRPRPARAVARRPGCGRWPSARAAAAGPPGWWRRWPLLPRARPPTTGASGW